jgi:cysteine desulfurase
MNENRIYLDYNATTPLRDEAFQEMLPYWSDNFGNPSSSHYYGREALKALNRGRERVAALLNALPEEIIFTSGGTESNNHAIIKGLEINHGKKQILAAEIEHSAVLSVCKYLAGDGFECKYIPVDGDGIIDIAALETAIGENTAILSVMTANNETGAIEPIEEIAKIAKRKNILFHTDAVQAAGKIPIDVRDSAVDMLSISSHKISGPKGIGALFVRRGIKLSPFIYGGNQERRMRAGTENVPGIAGFGKACELAATELDERKKFDGKLRELFLCEIRRLISDFRINTPPDKSLSNTLNIAFKSVPSEALVTRLDMKGVCISSGSACAGLSKISHVLKAMKVSEEFIYSAVRISFGRTNTEADVIRAAGLVAETANEIRKTQTN